jgi:hypothetical protein
MTDSSHKGSLIGKALNVPASRPVAPRRTSGKDVDVKENMGKRQQGKANTLVMRSLDQLARKYTSNGDGDASGQLQEVLDNHTGLMLFSNHLHSEYSSENIQFWEAARDFPHTPSLKECRRLVQLYIMEGSEFQINISQVVRNQVIEESGELGESEPDAAVWKTRRDLFELAKLEIFQLMVRDSFPRFRRSQLYRLYKKKLAIDQAQETRSEAKRRVENPCKSSGCGREGVQHGYCESHGKIQQEKSQALLDQIEASYTAMKNTPSLTLQDVLDHPLGSCFFAHHCAIEVKEAGESRLQGGTVKAKINPQHYYNCYKLISEFKHAPTFNTASLCVANHLETGAPCPVDISAGCRSTILGTIDPLRRAAREALGEAPLTPTRTLGQGDKPLDVDVFSAIPAPAADIFDEVAQTVLQALGEVFTRFVSSPWFEPCKAQMIDWDDSGSVDG